MKYNILEANILFKGNEVYRIVVLVEVSKDDVRAICATIKPMAGCINIPLCAKINDDLLQQVAAGGYEVGYQDKEFLFKNWQSRYNAGLYNSINL